jgi:hypothetical protein
MRDGNILGMQGPTATRVLTGRTCTVVQDELVALVLSGATGANFNNTPYAINPGQAATFPWLSKQAPQWEKYHFNQLDFYYKPRVSQFATAGTTGKVMYMVDFDASDSPATSVQQMEDTIPHDDCMPYQAMNLPLSSGTIHSLYKTLYVRPGGLPGASDIKTYDAGILNVATDGIAANTAKLGELRVKYSVTFSVPVLESSGSAPANNSMVTFESTAPENVPTSVTKQTLLLATQVGSLGAVNTNGSIVFPVGNYKFDWRCIAEFTGTRTDIQCRLEKNGTPVNINIPDDTGAQVGVTINDTGMFTSNGTDTFTLAFVAGFSSGTCTAAGMLAILAI